MMFWINDAKDVLSHIVWDMTPFAPIGANSMYFFRSSGIASHDLVVGNPDVWTVLIMQ